MQLLHFSLMMNLGWDTSRRGHIGRYNNPMERYEGDGGWKDYKNEWPLWRAVESLKRDNGQHRGSLTNSWQNVKARGPPWQYLRRLCSWRADGAETSSGLNHSHGGAENAEFSSLMSFFMASILRAPTGKEWDSETSEGDIWVDTFENFECSDSPECFAKVAATLGLAL